jgi:hypothetical protein
MWFWRRRRQPPPVLLPPLDRLAELVDSVVSLLDEAPPSPPEQAAAEERHEVAEVAEAHVLFVASPAGYRLHQREGPPPAVGDLVELDEGRFRVLRLGPSPLPGDRRRSAFVEQEQPGANRTSTSE